MGIKKSELHSSLWKSCDHLRGGMDASQYKDYILILLFVSASRDQLGNNGFCYLHYGDIHKSTKTHVNIDEEFIDLPKFDIDLKSVAHKSLLKHGDVVFVDASEDSEGTSKHTVIYNHSNTPFILGLHTIVAKSKDDTLDVNFKHYCFQTESLKGQFVFFAAGTKVSGISKTNIAKITLSYPLSIEEQQAIAKILSDMGAEITALEQKREKYKAVKQGMMQQLLTGKIRLV